MRLFLGAAQRVRCGCRALEVCSMQLGSRDDLFDDLEQVIA
jgi:hypothetical protein